MWAHEVPDDIGSLSHKLNDTYLVSEFTQELLTDTRLQSVLTALLNDDPVIINSLNFHKGSTQPLHLDTYFMPPPVDNAMAVVSVCLEDLDPLADPLTYVPGSHKIEPYRFPNGELAQGDQPLAPATEYVEAEIAKRGLEAERFIAKRGDVADSISIEPPHRSWSSPPTGSASPCSEPLSLEAAHCSKPALDVGALVLYELGNLWVREDLKGLGIESGDNRFCYIFRLDHPVGDDVCDRWIISFGHSRANGHGCLLYTSPSPRDRTRSRMPSSA